MKDIIKAERERLIHMIQNWSVMFSGHEPEKLADQIIDEFLLCEQLGDNKFVIGQLRDEIERLKDQSQCELCGKECNAGLPHVCVVCHNALAAKYEQLKDQAQLFKRYEWMVRKLTEYIDEMAKIPNMTFSEIDEQIIRREEK